MSIKKTKEALLNNWPAKILCAAIALFIFIFHRMASLETRNLTVPLNINGVSELMISNDIQKDVRVILRGNEKDITQITDNDIIAFIDLTIYNDPGRYEVPIRITKRGTALQVDPLEIDIFPPVIGIDLSKKLKKIVAVYPSMTGVIPKGYEIESQSVVPASIEIEGPESIVSTMASIPTESIDLSNRIVSFTKNVRLTTGNPLVTIEGLPNAEFKAEIKNVLVLKVFETVPVNIKNLQEGYIGELQTTDVELWLTGTNSDISKITLLDSILYVDCSEIEKEDEYTLSVLIDSIDGITVVEIKPATISVVIKKEK